jgi:hypothetical protein
VPGAAPADGSWLESKLAPTIVLLNRSIRDPFYRDEAARMLVNCTAKELAVRAASEQRASSGGRRSLRSARDRRGRYRPGVV